MDDHVERVEHRPAWASLSPDEYVTYRGYEKCGKNWVKQHEDPNFWHGELLLFRAMMPHGAILEIGSGGGRDAHALLAAGYQYVGVDISPVLLQEARDRNPQGVFYELSVYQLNMLPTAQRFHGFWASAVLLHVPKWRIDEALTSIIGRLMMDAIGFIAIKEGEGERIIDDPTDLALRRFFAYYSDEEFREVLARHQFVVTHFFRRVGTTTSWLIYFVKRCV